MDQYAIKKKENRSILVNQLVFVRENQQYVKHLFNSSIISLTCNTQNHIKFFHTILTSYSELPFRNRM